MDAAEHAIHEAKASAEEPHREREKIEDFCAIPPSICIAILPLALIIETIDLTHKHWIQLLAADIWQMTTAGSDRLLHEGSLDALLTIHDQPAKAMHSHRADCLAA